MLWEKVSLEWGATPQSKLLPADDAAEEEEEDKEDEGAAAELGVVWEGARLGRGTEGEG